MVWVEVGRCSIKGGGDGGGGVWLRWWLWWPLSEGFIPQFFKDSHLENFVNSSSRKEQIVTIVKLLVTSCSRNCKTAVCHYCEIASDELFPYLQRSSMSLY